MEEVGRFRAEEAKKAAVTLKKRGFTFDIAFTSVLKRAIRTLWVVLEQMDMTWIPIFKSWRLNERHYGALQGLNKAETAVKYGEKQVHIWRRSYDVRPPELEINDIDIWHSNLGPAPSLVATNLKFDWLGEDNIVLSLLTRYDLRFDLNYSNNSKFNFENVSDIITSIRIQEKMSESWFGITWS